MKYKLESTLLGEISVNLRYADDTTLMAQIKEELKILLMKVKEESEKVGLFFFSFLFFLILKSLILTCVPKHEPPSHLPPHNRLPLK